GMESGGHIGKLTTMALVPQVVDAVNIPVLAAGGIADSRGVNAAFMLGADGVQVGTRFLVATECTVHQNYKNKVLKAKDIDTVITGNITGHPVRVLKNKLTKAYLDIEKKETGKDEPDLEKLEELGTGALKKAVVDGDVDNGSVMSGQIAGLVKQEESCADIIQDLIKDLDKVAAVL
ncbi:MAG: nitronate monooxygenase, partial [Eubacterium sp.]|nr:nitronate monooxygenase [Eubacterium sp.]